MPRSALLSLSGAALISLLAACGGGGGDAGVQPPVVTLSTTSSVKYGETLLVTLTGVRLDQALTLESTGCRNFVRSTTAPTSAAPPRPTTPAPHRARATVPSRSAAPARW